MSACHLGAELRAIRTRFLPPGEKEATDRLHPSLYAVHRLVPSFLCFEARAAWRARAKPLRGDERHRLALKKNNPRSLGPVDASRAPFRRRQCSSAEPPRTQRRKSRPDGLRVSCRPRKAMRARSPLRAFVALSSESAWL